MENNDKISQPLFQSKNYKAVLSKLSMEGYDNFPDFLPDQQTLGLNFEAKVEEGKLGYIYCFSTRCFGAVFQKG